MNTDNHPGGNSSPARIPEDSSWLTNFPPVQYQDIAKINLIPEQLSATFLKQKYVEEGLSTRDISRQFFSARSTVVHHLKLHGIPLREEKVAHAMNKGQLGYGEKKIKREQREHKRELVNIEKMKALRAEGFSYHKIALILNSLNVPTKNKGSKWHATTVMKILKRQCLQLIDFQ